MYDILGLEVANSIEEALLLLKDDKNKKVISGGTDVLVKLRDGEGSDIIWVSIHDIKELKGVSMEEDGTISIKAGTTFTQVEKDEILNKNIPLLSSSAAKVGGPQVRNMGTIGGNVCNGATSADTAPALFALNAKLKLRTYDSERIVNIADFYKGPGKVDLKPQEMLTEILISPEDYRGYHGHYIKYAMRNAMDIATLGCVVLCKFNEDYSIEDYRLSYGVAGPTPLRCHEAEKIAKGKKVDDDLLLEIAKIATTEVNCRTSWRASKEFRLHLVEEMSKRAMLKILNDVRGEKNA